MNLTALQKAAAQAIVNIFETGSIRGNYADVTLMRGDTGQLTYGRSQTTLASGNLYLLIADYAARADGAYAKAMQPYLAALETRDGKLNTDMTFRSLLKDAGDDPVMHEVQDAFFDRIYWDPAMRSADVLGAQSPLGAAIIYDSTVHGSWAHVRDMTRRLHGELTDIGEKEWMAHYVDVRRNWLATHPNPLLHKTVYRMDAFKTLLDAENWPLALAMAVRGLTISEEALGGADPVKITADGAPRRLLSLTAPPLAGADVSWLQERLARAGITVAASGTFDEATDQAVRAFQQSKDLKADGVVGPVTRSALEDLSVTAPVAVEVPDEPMPAIAVPAITEPYVAIAPLPRAPDAPAAPAGHPALPLSPHPAPATSPDAMADLKQHVTNEVQAGIENVKNSVNEQNARIVQNLMAGNVQGALAQIDQSRTLVQRIFANGRGFFAAFLSLITLILTESHDLLAWTNTTGPAQAPQLSAAHGPAQATGPAQDVYQFMGRARDWTTETYVTLHNFAATIPNDWIFRARVVALALIAYAVMRFAKRRKAAAPAK
jgi:chitosanase